MTEILQPFSNKEIKIYKTSLPFENKKDFISNVQKGYPLSTFTIYPNKEIVKTPGWQYPLVMDSDVITDFRNRSLSVVKNIVNEKSELFVRFDWIFEPTKDTQNGSYHHHSYNGFAGVSEHIFMQNIPNQWTYTYYFQMPENDEGLLWFKHNDEEFSVKPNVEDLFLFPANLKHKYDASPNSDINRICYASNILFVDINKEYTKTKTVI